jgi:hypothetical protein
MRTHQQLRAAKTKELDGVRNRTDGKPIIDVRQSDSIGLIAIQLCEDVAFEFETWVSTFKRLCDSIKIVAITNVRSRGHQAPHTADKRQRAEPSVSPPHARLRVVVQPLPRREEEGADRRGHSVHDSLQKCRQTFEFNLPSACERGRGTSVAPSPSFVASSAESDWLSCEKHNLLKSCKVAL